MGKAMLDLPDPLEKPNSTSSTPANADDLLAQLAGEEIDRLLSEADARPEDLALRPPEPAAPFAPDSEPPIPKQNKPAFVEQQLAVAAQAAESDLSQQLDDLFNKLVEPDAAPPPATPAVVTVEFPSAAAEQAAEVSSEPEPQPPISVQLDPARAASELATSVEERSALDLVSAEAEAAELHPDNSADAAAQPKAPIWLLPLEWLNAPLDACPESLRQAIGKIALLTTFNAVAVLIYVFFFRKH